MGRPSICALRPSGSVPDGPPLARVQGMIKHTPPDLGVYVYLCIIHVFIVYLYYSVLFSQ